MYESAIPLWPFGMIYHQHEERFGQLERIECVCRVLPCEGVAQHRRMRRTSSSIYPRWGQHSARRSCRPRWARSRPVRDCCPSWDEAVVREASPMSRPPPVSASMFYPHRRPSRSFFSWKGERLSLARHPRRLTLWFLFPPAVHAIDRPI